MTTESIFEILVQHHEETGEVMKPTQFATIFHDAEPHTMVQAIHCFDAYLEEKRRKEKHG